MKKSKLCLFSLVVLLGLVGCNNTSNTSSSVTSSAASSVSDTSSNTPSSTPVSSNTPSSTPVTSSSSSSEAIKHTITKKIAPQLFARDDVEGTSTITFDKESYLAGETVTYTIVTDEYAWGYNEDVFNKEAIIVVGGEAIPFNVKQNEDVEWEYVGSFIMPDVKEKDVTFYAAPYSIIYYGEETSPALKTITYDVCDGIVAIGPSSFKAGSRLYSITLHRTKSIAITKASLTIGSSTTTLDVSSLNWQNDFVTLSLGSNVANDNVSLKIEGREVQTYKLNIVGTEYVSFYNGNPAGNIMESASIDFSFGFKSGYNVTYTITGATNTSYSPTNRIQFVMPSNDVTITFTGSSYASISVQTVEHVTSSKIYVAEGSSKVEATSCQAGSSFYVTAELETGYKLGEAYLLGHEDDKVSPNSVYWGYDSSTYSSIYKDCYTFTMPSDGSPATVVISVVKSGTITLTSDDDHYTSCVVKDSPYSYGASEKSLSDFAPGDDFYLFPVVKDGFRLTGATISDGTTSNTVTAEYSSNSYYVKGTMPDNGIANVTFTFGQVYGVSIENESDISNKVRFSFSDYSKQYAEGSNVKINISEVFGFTLNGLSYKDNNGVTVDLEIKTDSYSRKYVEFTMPGYAITLTPSISEATKVSVSLGYKNNSSLTLDMVKVCSSKNSSTSVEGSSVASGADVSETKDLYDGDTINCQVRDYDAWSDELEDYAQRFNVIVEVTYSDGNKLTENTTFEYGAYSASVALESDIESVIIVITDAASSN